MRQSSFDPIDERPAWNTGRKLGAKRPLKPKEIWAIRFFLDQKHRLRDRALFDLAIDSKLRGCDLVKIRTGDLVSGGRIRNRAMVIQQKTKQPVQFELLEPARSSIFAWLERRGGSLEHFAFPSRIDHSDHISTRQYARLVDEWVDAIGLRREDYGTHSRQSHGKRHEAKLRTFGQRIDKPAWRKGRGLSSSFALCSRSTQQCNCSEY